MTKEQENLFELLSKWDKKRQEALETAESYYKWSIEKKQESETLSNCMEAVRDIIYPKEEREKDEEV